MVLCARAGTPMPWHSPELFLTSVPSLSCEEKNAAGFAESHWACTQISAACDVDQHSSQVAEPSMVSEAG